MTNETRIVGVLGGMGPDATVDFMAKVIALTPAEKDQEHIRMIVDHNPTVPNRQTAILADGEDPGPALADMAKRLDAAGADFLVIPCNTAHVFDDAITAVTDIPLISIIDVSIEAVAAHGVSKVGVLATDGCMRAGVFQKGLEEAGYEAIEPDDDELAELMNLVYQIKGGYQGERIGNAVRDLANALVARGAEAIIAGCTEIPLVLDDSALGVPLISSTDVLAEVTVERATS